MRNISKKALARIIQSHTIWLRSNGQEGTRADLSEADLPDAELPEANLVLADLSQANLSGANLLLADLSQANLSGANLSGADLSGGDLLLADFSGADLSGAELSVADLSGANLSKACLVAASMPQADFSGADLSGANLSGADLSGADLSGADLTGANLAQSRLSNANLSGTDLSGANLLLVSTPYARFRDANLSGIIIDSLTLLQLPTEAAKRFQQTFQVIELDRSGEFTIVREIALPEIYFQAGLWLLGYFATVLSEQYSPDDVRIRMELREKYVALVIEAASKEVKGKVQEALEIYGLILQEKLVIHALSDDPAQIRRLKSNLACVRALLEEERRLRTPETADNEICNADMKWLRDHVGSLLQHPEIRLKGDEKYVQELIPQLLGLRKFQGIIKGLMEQNSRIRPELSVLFQKLSLKAPDDEDIRIMERSLATIKKEAPDVFGRLADTFHKAGMETGHPVWGNIFHRIMDRLV